MFKNFQRRTSSKIKYFLFTIGTILLAIAVLKFAKIDSGPRLSPYPFGFNFAFTITEDPDASRLDQTILVYEFLKGKGLRTTIAVWIREGTRTNGIPDLMKPVKFGITCENPKYREYVKLLQRVGFEIALHGVSGGNDLRETTLEGYEEFKLLFGEYPKISIMHMQNLENVYWGKKVFNNGILRRMVGLIVNRSNVPYQGEKLGSPYFWGDILKRKTKYVRLWGTADINTLKFNPSMPYHDALKAYVNYWFSFSDGFGVKEFNNLISKDSVDKLVNERGACIVYTHFAHGFVSEGKLNETFQRRINYLVSQPDGWFVPASDLLDRLLLMKKVILIKEKDRFMVVNLNDVEIEGVTIIVPSGRVWYDLNGRKYEVNDEREIILETLDVEGAVVLLKNNPSVLSKEQRLTSTDNKMTVIDFQDAIYIVKNNGAIPERLSSEASSDLPLFDANGREVPVIKDDQYVASAWTGEKGIVLFKNKRVICAKNRQPGRWEYLNMVFQRALLYIKHNKGN